jgi:hypothetical protein
LTRRTAEGVGITRASLVGDISNALDLCDRLSCLHYRASAVGELLLRASCDSRRGIGVAIGSACKQHSLLDRGRVPELL